MCGGYCEQPIQPPVTYDFILFITMLISLSLILRPVNKNVDNLYPLFIHRMLSTYPQNNVYNYQIEGISP
jgi:hypothetical protein